MSIFVVKKNHFLIFKMFRQRVFRAAIHYRSDNNDIQEHPYFNATRTAVGPDEDSDDEGVYGNHPDVFRVERDLFDFNRHEIISKWINLRICCS